MKKRDLIRIKHWSIFISGLILMATLCGAVLFQTYHYLFIIDASSLTAQTFSLTQQARFFNPAGDHIGTGELPPKVGEAMTFWVRWKLDAIPSDLKSMSMSAALGPDVTWTGRAITKYGQIKQQDSSLVWSVNDFFGANSVEALLEVSLTPQPDQQGTTPILLQDLRMQARRVSGEFTNLSAPMITTELLGDAWAKGKGIVE